MDRLANVICEAAIDVVLEDEANTALEEQSNQGVRHDKFRPV